MITNGVVVMKLMMIIGCNCYDNTNGVISVAMISDWSVWFIDDE